MRISMRRYLCSATFLLFLLGTSEKSYAQTPVQVVRGMIKTSNSLHPLSQARISLADNIEAVYTADNGTFRWEAVPVGRYRMIVQCKGYQPYILPDLIVNAGKEVVLEILLEPQLYSLEEVVISDNSPTLNAISSRTFSVEETQRFAATFYDPARLVATFPGVVQANDQANHIAVRGNSPNGLLWRLEGADIVNPNHLTNAGTFSDRLSQNGGGQIILSTQLLDNSQFLTGAFSPQYGNALSGVFDMNLRKGNEEQYEFTAQAGLIGIDLAAEGPLSGEGDASFLANYRYSTIGLFGLLGLEISDEDISYQDLSFHISLPTKKAGNFTLFGVGGLSHTFFDAERDPKIWETQGDRFDIRFTSNMGAVGATHTLLLGERSLLRSVVALSSLKSTRTGDYLDDQFNATRVEDDEIQQTRLSFNSTLTHAFTTRSTLKGGLRINYLGYQLASQAVSLRDFQTQIGGADANGQSVLFQPYINWIYSLAPQFQFQVGIHAMYLNLNQTSSLEPRASLQWSISDRQQLALAYGLHSQMQLPGTYFATLETENGSLIRPNEGLGFTRAHHWVVSYTHQFNSQSSLKIEPYYQRLFDVPIVNNSNSSFSVLNLLEGYVTDSLVNEGTGTNYGLEVSWEQRLQKKYYFLFSGSLYESLYTGGDGIQRDTRFNGNYILSLSGGKEIRKANRKNRSRVTRINLRTVFQGGLRETPIDVAASTREQRTIFIEEQANSLKFKDYFRTDLRISFTRNKPKYTRTFSIDIQNLTNATNIAYRYFDILQGAVVDKEQLSIIPILSYRIDF